VTTEELMPNEEFRHPHDIEVGPDGALYIIEWGNNFNFAATGINPDSGLYRIEQRTGGLPALASAQATPTSGPAPLEVQFTGELSDRGADDPPTYEWDFGDGETSTEVNPTHTYTEAGTYEVTLTVTDAAGITTDTVTINVRAAVDCGPPRSDEFDGAELDADRWEVIRRDDERLSVSDGALHLVSAPMDIFQGETGMPNIVLQELPGGGGEPWSVTTEMTWDPTQNFQNAGMIVYGDDDNYIKTGMVWNGARNFELIKELGGTAEFPGGAAAGDVPSTYFLRLVSADGNAVTSEFSADGETWTEIGTTDLTGIASPRIGVYATASTQAGAGQPTASFHSVTIEPEREDCPTQCPSDEFDGAELDTAKWSFLHPSTETAPFVQDGNLVLTLSGFSFDADRPGPTSVLGQAMPLDDWEAVAKISAPDLNDDASGQSLFAKVGLIVWQENLLEPNKHFISYTHDRNADDEGASTFFEASAQNGPAGGDRILGDRVGTAPAEENLAGPFWIRINWVSINTGAASELNIEEIMPVDEGPIYVGPYGANGSSQAMFDYVRFTPEDPECDGEPDTTPPVTTAQLNGADPEPTYDGPVEVTLTAEDPGVNASGVDLTEYRVNPEGGGPQTHDVFAQGATWEPEQVEAALGDEVTWNFDEPEAQFPHDVWLVPPAGNPDPAGPDIFEVTDGTVNPGGPPVSYTPEEEGAWTFICRVHSVFSGGEWSGMVGTADVTGGGGWLPYTEPFTVSDEDDYLIEYRSTDVAGNVEDPNQVEFAITEDAGEPELRVRGVPPVVKVKPRKKQAKLRFLATNVGDAPTGPVSLCVKAPKKKLELKGKRCLNRPSIDPGQTGSRAVGLRVKPKARGKTTKVTLIARGPNVDTQRTTARVRVRK
jgi:cytochrome c